jgi:alkylation response protein AidB-like acyl-CoA dehydrogenase
MSRRNERAEQLLKDVHEILPLVAAHAGDAERQRKPVDEVMAAIEVTGIYNFFVPRRYGGWELDLDTYVDLGMLLGEACASTGWVTTFCMEHNWMFCHCPWRHRAQRQGAR